jgi:hypothetical protein
MSTETSGTGRRGHPLDMKSWLLASAIASVIGGGTIYYALFHLALGVPLLLLWQPYVIHAAITFVLGPLLYLAKKRQESSGGRAVGLYFWAIGPYCFSVI